MHLEINMKLQLIKHIHYKKSDVGILAFNKATYVF